MVEEFLHRKIRINLDLHYYDGEIFSCSHMALHTECPLFVMHLIIYGTKQSFLHQELHGV